MKGASIFQHRHYKSCVQYFPSRDIAKMRCIKAQAKWQAPRVLMFCKQKMCLLKNVFLIFYREKLEKSGFHV